MPCYRPLRGYRSKDRNESGKRSIVFNPRDGFSDLPVDVPCGQCIGCRLEKSRQWAIRCVHESQMHEHNCFITLTYDNDHLPKDESVNVEDFQKFMKRLRKKHGSGIRYFHCGEYGDNTNRPHYHACLFGLDFNDKIHFKTTNDVKIYTSEKLRKLWPFGHSTVGEVTFESAAYIARYVCKKINSDEATRVVYDGKKWKPVRSEYGTMSRRPGIGKKWYEKYKSDVYPSGDIVLRGKKMPPPQFYENMYQTENPVEFQNIRRRRLANNRKIDPAEFKDRRLRVKEIVKAKQAEQLKRNLE